MDTYEAAMTVEQGGEAEEDEIRALQALINSGTWGLQGSVGRQMMGAIESGICALGNEPATDSYGNRIPSRYEVKAGTTGSVEYVEERSPFGRVFDAD